MIWKIQHEESGSSASFVGQPIHLTNAPIGSDNAQFSPDLGQHTNTVLKDLLGVSNEQLDEWRIQGVFGKQNSE